MFQIIDRQKNHTPAKSRFQTPAQAFKWAKKNLPTNSCSKFGELKDTRYFIKMY